MRDAVADPLATGRLKSPWMWNVLVLILASVASAGSLYLSIGLGLKACPLCFYQRSFAIAALLVQATLIALDGLRSPRACVTALPLLIAGLSVAAFHVYLVQTGKLECPLALFGWGDGPVQSYVVFVASVIACLTGAWQSAIRQRLAFTIAGIVVGASAAAACIASAPPLPPAPDQPYDAAKPFDICRPPYREGRPP